MAQNPCCLIIEPTDTNTTVMRSGGLLPLQTRTRPIEFPNPQWQYSISFDFGFGTDEIPLEGEILDSVTLVMENTNTGVSAVLFTADANGFGWLPFIPAGLPLLGDALEVAPIAFPDIEPLPAQLLAYHVSFAVPPALSSNWANLRLVLYDYPNGLNSVGWLGPVTVVPPPGELAAGPTNLFQPIGPEGGGFSPATKVYVLTNTGGQTLSWRATASVNWLTLSPQAGDLAPAAVTNVTVNVNVWARVMSPGIYSGALTFTNRSAVTNTEVRPVKLIIPARPRLMAASPQGSGELRLQLQATPTLDYRIESSPDFVSWTPIHTNSTAADGSYLYSEQAASFSRFYRATFVKPLMP